MVDVITKSFLYKRFEINKKFGCRLKCKNQISYS